MQDENEIVPLKQINVNYKTKDVSYIHLKKKNALSPQVFNSQIRVAAQESVE